MARATEGWERRLASWATTLPWMRETSSALSPSAGSRGWRWVKAPSMWRSQRLALGSFSRSLRLRAALSAPQSEWPQRMTCFTLRTSTAYSMVAVTPSTSLPLSGTTLPMLRERNRSPGPVWRSRAGTMQAPEWLFITCSDSRIVPDLILQPGPGDLFLSRSIGNVVPVSGNDVDGVTATIEYAVEVLKVKHIILCGHSDCGALKAALNRKDLEKLPKASRWLRHIEGAFTHRQPLDPADGESAELVSLIQGNVVAQLANLRSQPSVARAITSGALEVHGWYYDILTGHIEQYDEQQRK